MRLARYGGPLLRWLLLLPFLSAVAPWSLPEWRRAETALRARLVELEALEEATARLHNAHGPARRRCDDDPLALGARAARFGAAWGDAVRDVEGRLARLQTEADGPLVAPLLDADARRRLAALSDAVSSSRRRVDEAAGWHARFVADCPLPLSPFVGFVRGPTEARRARVAVLAVGGGRLCPADVPADGVHVIFDDEACLDPGPCACSPAPVAPGAVLVLTPDGS